MRGQGGLNPLEFQSRQNFKESPSDCDLQDVFHAPALPTRRWHKRTAYFLLRIPDESKLDLNKLSSNHLLYQILLRIPCDWDGVCVHSVIDLPISFVLGRSVPMMLAEKMSQDLVKHIPKRVRWRDFPNFDHMMELALLCRLADRKLSGVGQATSHLRFHVPC